MTLYKIFNTKTNEYYYRDYKTLAAARNIITKYLPRYYEKNKGMTKNDYIIEEYEYQPIKVKDHTYEKAKN